MSILVVHLVPEGLLFAADRNITHTLTPQTGYRLVGQTQRPKVLKWPNTDAIIGYVDEAEVDGEATDEWLYSFIGRHLAFPDFSRYRSACVGRLLAIFTGCLENR